MPPRKKSAPAEEKPLEIDGIPTARGLAQRGRQFAYPVPGGHHITAEGHRLLGDLLREKARRSVEEGTHNVLRRDLI